jgi:hypothetical protein
MMPYTKFLFILFLFIQNQVVITAQGFINVDFKFIYHQRDLIMDSLYVGNNQESIQFETLKFYISNLRFNLNNGKTFIEKNSWHLIEMEDRNSLHVSVPDSLNDSIRNISFNLGIDSTTNVSGALGGDLDPTQGMYWTWQNGYINFKLEGKSTLCKTRNNEFQFHIGGYMNPFNTLQKIELPINKVGSYTIVFDLEQLMDKIDLSILNHVMSPQLDAVEISKKIVTAFSIE